MDRHISFSGSRWTRNLLIFSIFKITRLMTVKLYPALFCYMEEYLNIAKRCNLKKNLKML